MTIMKSFFLKTAFLLSLLMTFMACSNDPTADNNSMGTDDDDSTQELSVSISETDVVTFDRSQTKSIPVTMTGQTNVSVSTLAGWSTDIDAGNLNITAPSNDDGARLGVITVTVSNMSGQNKKATLRVYLNEALPSLTLHGESILSFMPGETQIVAIQAINVKRVEISSPSGWEAHWIDGQGLSITAPASTAEGVTSGQISIYGLGEDELKSGGILIDVSLQKN